MTQSDIDKNKVSIDSLRETITSAEKTIQSAKAMLLQLEGKKRVGRKKKVDADEEGAIYGTFDGQIMIGNDGKQYPVPANYASKSKLVEGDMLKLVIDNGVFLYKQVGPIERKNLIGIASQDEAGNYFVVADGKPYKILLASITYFKIEPGDEVVITVPASGESTWAAVENVLQKSDSDDSPHLSPTGVLQKEEVSSSSSQFQSDSAEESADGVENSETNNETANSESDQNNADSSDTSKSVLDEWMSDIEEIKKEIQEEKIKTE